MYFWWHNELLTSWRIFLIFNVMTNFLTSWNIFDVTTNFFTSRHIFDVMTNFFWHHDMSLTPWHIFDAMTNFLTHWRTFCRHDVFFMSWCNFDFMTNFLTSWSIFDVTTNFLTLYGRELRPSWCKTCSSTMLPLGCFFCFLCVCLNLIPNYLAR